MTTLRIGLIGDFDPDITAHQAIPLALQLASNITATQLQIDWLATESLTDTASLHRFDGLWCTPGSPYRNTANALRAIQYAREHDLPFLGTCGGFQHALLEYAIHVLGWRDAEHAETAPDAQRAIISPLTCALVEASQTLTLTPNSRLARIYNTLTATETYRCRYGLNQQYQSALIQPPIIASAHDANGEVRAIELNNHSFFIATLFQPERGALPGNAVPLANALVNACAQFHQSRR